MKSYFVSMILLFGYHTVLYAQVDLPQERELQLETMAESNTDADTEDDAYQLEMEGLLKDPLDINKANESELGQLKLLTHFQVKQLLSYRRLLGNFVSIYELQAIPGWDIYSIRKIIPYVAIINKNSSVETIKRRILNGDHSILLRISQVLEKSRGYLTEPSSGKEYYAGSPQRFLIRYRYTYKNLLQYGITAEKDPGEQFFRGAQKAGFDFYSMHVCVRNLGILKTLLLGDYTVNLGQGLIQWQSMAFGKGGDMMNVKRQSVVLRPYTSTGEVNFHRGVALTVGKKYWESSFFISRKKLDASYHPADSSVDYESVSSVLFSGYHRHKSEIDHKGNQLQVAVGANFSYNKDRFHVGGNFMQYWFGYPFLKEADPYNLYVLKGNRLRNYGIDFGYTVRNMHIFGEVALSNGHALAYVNGLVASVSENVDLGVLYRNISPGYQSMYSNAFTENTSPSNEKGLFVGSSIKASRDIRLDAYVDFYRFPWLKYQVDAPSSGSGIFLKATYKPTKQLELYSFYRVSQKDADLGTENQIIKPIATVSRQNWRIQFNYKISNYLTVRSRVEAVWVKNDKSAVSEGYLGYVELINNSLFKRVAFDFRAQYFQVENYDARIYSFENEMLYSSSVPVFSGKGYRYYLNIEYKPGRRITVWTRFAQTYYPDQNSVGSGLDEIPKSHKSEAKLQVMYKF